MAFRSSGLRIPVDLSSFDEGIKMVCYFFGVSKLMKEQLHALRSFLSGRDLYFSAPTGFGKSLIFQSLPVLYDTIQGNLIGTSFVLVLSPLVSLIEEQVAYINEKTGIAAVYLHNDQDEAILRDVENGGVYALVYSSPECMLSNNRWRNLLTSKSFRENCIAVAVDEAHCIAHWYGTLFSKTIRVYHSFCSESTALFSLILFIHYTVVLLGPPPSFFI